jgi:peroxiredoxin
MDPHSPVPASDAPPHRVPHWLSPVLGGGGAVIVVTLVAILFHLASQPASGTALPSTTGQTSVGVSFPVTPTSGNSPTATRIPTARPPAPDFTLATLNDQPFHLADHRGQVVVVYFFAISCGTCVQGIQTVLQAVQAAHKENVAVVMIDFSPTDQPSDLQNLLQSTGLEAQLPRVWWGMDTTGTITTAYHIEVAGGTAVIDPQGRIALLSQGDLPARQLTQMVEDVA